MKYEAPQVRDLGSVRDLTQQQFNKLGNAIDAACQTVPGLVGSIVPIP